MIAAIVLSAGKSERMGRPKALLPFAGRTFLETILAAIASTPVAHTVVVLGHHRDIIQQAVRIANPVFNAGYERGMLTSIQAGIRALPAEAEGALLFLVDHPVTSAASIASLLEKFQPGCIVVPTFEGRRGHPVLFSRAILDEILALPLSAGANTVVWKDPQRVIEVAVQDPGIHIDVDTPEQFDRLQ